MKLKPEAKEVDLYVSSKKMSEKESKELGEFIEDYKLKRAKKFKGKKAA